MSTTDESSSRPRRGRRYPTKKPRESENSAPSTPRRGRWDPPVPTRPAYDVALDMLARQERTAEELRRKLRLKGHEAEAIETALERLAANEYQSDARTAAAVVRTQLGRSSGPRKIQMELTQKGIDRDEAKIILESMTEDRDWEQEALEAVERRFGVGPDDVKVGNRIMGFLARRGYGGDVIGKVRRTRGWKRDR